MMGNRYDKYKDSGIAWIGEIPEHWKVIPHKRIMRKKKIIKEFYAGENILSLTKKGVIIRDLEAGGKMPTTFNGYQVLYPDNLLMCLFDIDVTPRCVGIIKDEGLSSPAYSQFILNELGYTPFFDYLLRYMDDEKCLLHLSKNLRNSLTEDDFGQIETIVPSFPEQQAIADYLDWKCGEIDELITLQEEMITKLQSYKQSVITEAVTKGLDKNVPLKDSGIEWIGKIPEHWKVKKLGHLYIPRNEKVSDQDYPALSVTMQGVLLQLENVAKTNDGDNRKLVKIGDFAINSRSDRRGSCGISKYDGSVSLINTVLIPINDMNPVFYEWLFHSSLFSDEYYRWGHGIVNDLWTTKWQEIYK